MKIVRLENKENEFEVFYNDKAELESEYNKNLKFNAIEIPYFEELELYKAVKISLSIVDSSKKYSINGKVIHIPLDRDSNIGIEITSEEGINQIKRDLESSDLLLIDKELTHEGHVDSHSLMHRLKNLSLAEKIRFALRGGRDVRKVLFSENHPKINLFLLQNPKITGDEIAALAKDPRINTDVLILISRNSDWMKVKSIRFNVIKNPKTSLAVIRRYINLLSSEELRILAKSQSVKEIVGKLAKGLLSKK